MINKIDPGVREFLETELLKQKEQIVERMIWESMDTPCGLTYEDIEYYVGVSREKIEEPEEKCRWKYNCEPPRLSLEGL